MLRELMTIILLLLSKITIFLHDNSNICGYEMILFTSNQLSQQELYDSTHVFKFKENHCVSTKINIVTVSTSDNGKFLFHLR